MAALLYDEFASGKLQNMKLLPPSVADIKLHIRVQNLKQTVLCAAFMSEL